MSSNAAPHIPDHELLRRIGRGSYGEVWLARSATGAYRAVKVIYRDSFDHERPYEREFAGIRKFEPISRGSETQVDILHVGRNDVEGLFYYVMELADDQKTGRQINPDDYTPRTLRSELFQRGRLPMRECLEIGVQLAMALEHLHGSGLIHRDIKPSNIVFVNGTPKLADVGLVTTLDATRSFVGTEGYIPSDGPGTPQADIYSLGKVLYEISTGRDRLDFPELPTDLKDHPEREKLVQFNEVLLKACDENPKNRYRAANEMLLDLRRLKAGELIRRARFAPGWKRLTGIVLLAGVLVVGLIWGIKGIRSTRTLNRTSNSQVAGNPGEPPLTSELAGWWQAEGNALDSSGTNHGRLIEGVGFDAGKIGQAFVFNGKTACISVPNSPDWTFSKADFSIALWASFSAVSNTQAFLACEKGHRDVERWMFCLRDGRLRWHMDEGGKPVWLGAAKFSPVIGRWYHLAVTRQGDQFRSYIDGDEVSSEVWSGEVPRVVAPLTIGNAWGGLCFSGLLDDVRIYKRALAPEELRTLSLAEWSAVQKLDDVVIVGTRRYQRHEFMINTSFEDDTSQANLAVLANGDILATWHQGLHWHCYGQVFNAHGVPVGSVFLLNPGSPSSVQWGPSPAPLPDGGFVVAYGESGPTRAVSAAQRFDSTCTPVGARFGLELPDWTALASHTNGDFVAAGTYAVGSRGNRDLPIMARRFNAEGTPYGAAFQVGAATNGTATVSAAYGADGRFAFAWPSDTRNAMVRAYRSNEFSPFSVEFCANSSKRKGLVSARYGLNNELFVVWSGSTGSGSNAVYVRRFDANLVAQGAEWQVNEHTIPKEWVTSLSLGTNSEALVTWDASDNNIYGRLLDQNGNSLGHEFRVNQHTDGSRTLGWEACLHTAVLDNGNLVAGWAGNGASGNGVYLTMLKLIADTSSRKGP
jgi:serine/threonine protein kinase